MPLQTYTVPLPVRLLSGFHPPGGGSNPSERAHEISECTREWHRKQTAFQYSTAVRSGPRRPTEWCGDLSAGLPHPGTQHTWFLGSLRQIFLSLSYSFNRSFRRSLIGLITWFLSSSSLSLILKIFLEVVSQDNPALLEYAYNGSIHHLLQFHEFEGRDGNESVGNRTIRFRH